MKVADLMVPLSGCARVAEDRTLYDAVVMLEAWRRRIVHTDFRPRFVLVHDSAFRVVGILRPTDMLQTLAKTAESGGLTLSELVAVAPKVKARDAMHRFAETECAESEAPLAEATRRMLAGSLSYLLVRREAEPIGILRLTDLFASLCTGISKAGMR